MKIKTNNPQRHKLVDYFNKFNYDRGVLFTFKYEDRFDDAHIISKSDCFIDWLVKKQKIKPSVIKKLKAMSNRMNWMFIELSRVDTLNTSTTDMLIMFLSIQDSPIEVLLDIIY